MVLPLTSTRLKLSVSSSTTWHHRLLCYKRALLWVPCPALGSTVNASCYWARMPQVWGTVERSSCLHDTHEAGLPACLAPTSTRVRRQPSPFGEGSHVDSPRTFLFLPLHQGTGPTLDPASCPLSAPDPLPHCFLADDSLKGTQVRLSSSNKT